FFVPKKYIEANPDRTPMKENKELFNVAAILVESKNIGRKNDRSLVINRRLGMKLEFSNRQRCASQKMSGFCPSASCCSYALWASLSSCDSTSMSESSPA